MVWVRVLYDRIGKGDKADSSVKRMMLAAIDCTAAKMRGITELLLSCRHVHTRSNICSCTIQYSRVREYRGVRASLRESDARQEKTRKVKFDVPYIDYKLPLFFNDR